jgi:SurA N-terminal domain.
MGRQKAKGKRLKAKVPSQSASARIVDVVLHGLLANWFGSIRYRSLTGAAGSQLAAGRRRAVFIIAFCLLPFAFCLQPSGRAEARQKVVDQIIALVNEDIITRSDLLWSLAMDPQAPNPAEGVSSDLLRQKLDVLIDQRLIAQEARRVPTAEITVEDINQRRAALIRDFKSETIFRQRVEAVGLTSSRVDELIRERILIERFVDFRFRSFVFVTEQEIQRYYDEVLAAQIRARGQVAPSLDDKIKDDTGKEVTVRDFITEIIRREKINQEIDRFLNATRQRADITILTEP